MAQRDAETNRFVSVADDDTLIEMCRQAVACCRKEGARKIRQKQVAFHLCRLLPGAPLPSSICQRLGLGWGRFVELLEQPEGQLDPARLSDILTREERRPWPTLMEIEAAFRIVSLRIGREDWRRDDYAREHERIAALDRRHWAHSMLSRYGLPDDQQIDDALRRLGLTWYTARERFGMQTPERTVPGDAGMPVSDAIVMCALDLGVMPGPDLVRDWATIKCLRVANWSRGPNGSRWKQDLEEAKGELLKLGPLPKSTSWGKHGEQKYSFDGLQPVPADHPYRRKDHVNQPWTRDRLIEGLAFALGRLPKGKTTLSATVLAALAKRYPGIVPHYSKLNRYGPELGFAKPLPELRAEAIKLRQGGWTPPAEWETLR